MDTKEFTETKATIKAFREKLKKEGKDLFLSMSKTLFDENPNLVVFGWRQYTPYFNDGDACTFSAQLDSPNFLLEGQDEDLYDEQEWFPSDDDSAEALTYRKIASFLEQFDDEDVEMFFGDHVEVKVYRNRVETEEYSHD